MDNESSRITLEQVRQFMASQFNVTIDEISPGLTFGDLPQWDSLGHMSLMAALEDNFGKTVKADEIAELISLEGIHKFLSK